MRQNGCPVKLGEGEDWSWTFLSASSLSYLNDWRASHATNVSWRAADPGGCPWGPPFPQHTISRFGESTRQLEDGYDWRMALDFGLRKLDIFWPYCAEEKGTVGSMACNSASLPCFCRAFWDVSHHFIPVICCGKKSPKVNVFQKTIISLMRHQLEFYIDFLSQILWVEQKCTEFLDCQEMFEKMCFPGRTPTFPSCGHV